MSLIAMNWCLIGLSAMMIVEYNLKVGSDRLAQQSVRFALTILMCWGVYRGYRPVKWIAVTLSWLAGFGFLMVVLPAYERWSLSWIAYLLSALTYLMYARTLIWSRPVNAFLQSQSEERSR